MPLGRDLALSSKRRIRVSIPGMMSRFSPHSLLPLQRMFPVSPRNLPAIAIGATNECTYLLPVSGQGGHIRNFILQTQIPVCYNTLTFPLAISVSGSSVRVLPDVVALETILMTKLSSPTKFPGFLPLEAITVIVIVKLDL